MQNYYTYFIINFYMRNLCLSFVRIYNADIDGVWKLGGDVTIAWSWWIVVVGDCDGWVMIYSERIRFYAGRGIAVERGRTGATLEDDGVVSRTQKPSSSLSRWEMSPVGQPFPLTLSLTLKEQNSRPVWLVHYGCVLLLYLRPTGPLVRK